MPLVAIASLKASPGVTTAALALAAAWPAQRRLLIEADPSGGDLGAWLGLPPAPGLASLTASARHDHRRGLIWRHAQELPGGVHAIVAPPGAGQAGACLATLAGPRILFPFTREPAIAIADCGRLDPGSPALAVAAQAGVTLLLIRPYLSELSHLAPRITSLIQAGLRLRLLLASADGCPLAGPVYPAREITAALHLPVQASIPRDARAVARLINGRGALPSGKSPLAQAAAGLAAALDATASWPDIARLAARSTSEPAPGEVTAGGRAV